MKKTANRIVAILLLLCIVSVSAYGVEYLIPVGQVIGLQLSDGNVTIAAFDDILGSPAREAGLMIGDTIVSIDGRSIHDAQDIRAALNCSGGQVEVMVRRKNGSHTLTLSPQITSEGPKLGVYLSQGITGIGTVTWYDPETKRFGTLGHGVHDGSGKLLALSSGTVFDAAVASVKQGLCGEPGQLRGSMDSRRCLGVVERNTPQGVFGTAQDGWQGQAVPVGCSDQVHTGEATIRSTVSGRAVREYSVEIVKLYPKSNSTGRNMLIRITDPALLEVTGGIVQGMSGSPLVQDGKLIGAVTHVLVNDPTMGYGIFIENMLDAAG